VLVPDSNDAPEDLPDLIEEPHSDIETHPERDFRNFQEHHDLLPKKLFNSSPAPSPPTKPVSRHSNGTDKGKGKVRLTMVPSPSAAGVDFVLSRLANLIPAMT
jgi:hypothetical protein